MQDNKFLQGRFMIADQSLEKSKSIMALKRHDAFAVWLFRLPFRVEDALFVYPLIGMGTKIITLRLYEVSRQSF